MAGFLPRLVVCVHKSKERRMWKYTWISEIHDMYEKTIILVIFYVHLQDKIHKITNNK